MESTYWLNFVATGVFGHGDLFFNLSWYNLFGKKEIGYKYIIAIG